MKINEIASSQKVWVVIHQPKGTSDLSILGVFSTVKLAQERFADFAKEHGEDEAPRWTYVQAVTLNKSIDVNLN